MGVYTCFRKGVFYIPKIIIISKAHTMISTLAKMVATKDPRLVNTTKKKPLIYPLILSQGKIMHVSFYDVVVFCSIFARKIQKLKSIMQ